MNGQQSLLPDEEPPPKVSRPLEEFLAGIAARYAFGETARTNRQRAAAEHAADLMSGILIRLKAGEFGA